MIDQLAAVLRGDPGAMDAVGLMPPEQARTVAERHGVLPMVADRLADAPATPLYEAFRREASVQMAADLIREDALRRIVRALRTADVPTLVIKGAHLAYSIYARPDLRPRIDTDLLVRVGDQSRAENVLLQDGYVGVPQAEGSLVNYQRSFSLLRDEAVIHVVDLHWRVANPQAFGDVLTFADLDRTGHILPGLADARVPSSTHAMLLAAMHQVAHHPRDARLIWACDIDGLARQTDDAAWQQLVSEASERGIGAVLARSLDQAATWLGTPVPDWVMREPRLRSAAAQSVPTAAFLDSGRRHVEIVAQDLRLLPTWSARSRLVWQHVFPPRHYMRTVYAPASGWPLPLLYVRRAWRGARRWLVKS